MKILMMLDQPNLYGSEMHFLDLATYFNDEAEVKVIVLRDGPLLKLLSQKNIGFTIMPSGWFPSLTFLKNAYAFLRSFSPDIIHSHQPKANFMAALLKIFYKKKNIVTIHSKPLDHSLLHKSMLKRKAVFVFHLLVQFWSEWVAAKIIYVSHSSSKSSFFPSKVMVIYNWLKDDKTGRLWKNKSTEPIETIKIVSVGSVTYAKGFDLLIDFASLLRPHPFKIHILGSDENVFGSKLKQHVIDNNIDSIIFHGYQSDISTYLERARYFALFSRSETFGLSYIEAMSFGLPVLSLDYDTMREIIPTGNSVSNDLQRHVDYLIDMQKNPDRYEKVSSANKAYVLKAFDYRSAMEKYKKLYEDILLAG
jgi:glycosyltransferase involved in cell wall biosynthesis